MELFETLITALAAGVLGIFVGAMINALADDLPQRQNPRLPHYPNGHPRPPGAWSGLLAFLTGQREGPPIRIPPEEEARYSLSELAHLEYDTRLSWRHPLTEIAMAALFIFVVTYPFEFPRVGVWLVFISILMLITIIDLEHRLILFVVIIPSAVIVLALNVLFPANSPSGERDFIEYVWGGVLGGVVFFILYLGGGVFADAVAAMRGQSLAEVAFGFGDVMLAILCGFMIGWRAMIFAMFITVFAGAIGALAYMAYRLISGQRYAMYTALPYGPYIVFGTLVMMLFIDQFREFIR